MVRPEAEFVQRSREFDKSSRAAGFESADLLVVGLQDRQMGKPVLAELARVTEAVFLVGGVFVCGGDGFLSGIKLNVGGGRAAGEAGRRDHNRRSS